MSSLDDPLSVYLDDPVPDVSIRDVLTMRSGLRLGEHPEKPMEGRFVLALRRAGSTACLWVGRDHIRHDLLDRAGENIQGPFAYFFGHQGQIVYFLPDKGIVAVRFGAQPQLLHSTLYELFR